MMELISLIFNPLPLCNALIALDTSLQDNYVGSSALALAVSPENFRSNSKTIQLDLIQYF